MSVLAGPLAGPLVVRFSAGYVTRPGTALVSRPSTGLVVRPHQTTPPPAPDPIYVQ